MSRNKAKAARAPRPEPTPPAPEDVIVDVEETPPAPRPPSPPVEAQLITAFAVVLVDGLHTPVRITLDGLTPFKAEPTHPGAVYEALAYEYLQGDVALEYERLTVERSKAVK